MLNEIELRKIVNDTLITLKSLGLISECQVSTSEFLTYVCALTYENEEITSRNLG